MINMKKNILIFDGASEMGYVIPETEYALCDNLRKYKLCKLDQAEVNLKTSQHCITEFFYHNKTTNCETRVLRTQRDIWIPTIRTNYWTYIAPLETTVHFTHGENTTTFKILGLGTLQIGPDEYISTDNVQISYFD